MEISHLIAFAAGAAFGGLACLIGILHLGGIAWRKAEEDADKRSESIWD
ncbi:MAG: hypothetical protein HY894_09670 [Deltaproteobacteria bacterium]|nr:hypothetical protein [Deltaproteobacteria bacterium]